MRSLILLTILSCILSLGAQTKDLQEDSVLDRFLTLKSLSSQQVLSDIYNSMMEIDHNIKADPSYDISMIMKWRDKVEQVLKAKQMRSFLVAAKLSEADAIDFDGLARSIWFPEDFLFTVEDRQLLKLLKASALKQAKD